MDFIYVIISLNTGYFFIHNNWKPLPSKGKVDILIIIQTECLVSLLFILPFKGNYFRTKENPVNKNCFK